MAMRGAAAMSHSSATTLIYLIVCAFSLIRNSLAACPASTPSLARVIVRPGFTPLGCCGDPANPCGSLYEALERLAAGGTIVLRAGSHSLFPAGGNLTKTAGLDLAPFLSTKGPLSIISNLPSPGDAVLDCQGMPCLSALCAAGPGAGASVCKADSYVILSGFSIRNGASTGNGGCLRVRGALVSITGMVFDTCSAYYLGGAISVINSQTFDMENSVVQNSYVSGTPGSTPGSGQTPLGEFGGGGIYVGGSSTYFKGVSVNTCYTYFGGGGGIFAVSSVVIVENTVVDGCLAMESGGGIGSVTSQVNLTRVSISNSQATNGGCYSDNSSSIVGILHSNFTGCSVNRTFIPSLQSAMGGGLYFESTQFADLSSVLVTQCKSDLWGGCAMAYNVQTFVSSRSSFENCSAFQLGGGIYMWLVTQFGFENGSVSFNYITYPDSTSNTQGGGLFLRDSSAVILNSFLNGNYANKNAGVSGEGGGVYVGTELNTPTYFQMDNCSLEGNQATAGGGISVSSGDVTITNSRFLRNGWDKAVGTKKGGGALVTTPSSFTNCLFEGNYAQVQGGGMAYDTSGGVLLDTCVFFNNTVDVNDGGALWVRQGISNVTINNGQFLSNQATGSRAGAIFTQGTQVYCTSCLFQGNKAALKGGAVVATGSQAPPDYTMFVCQYCQFLNNYSPLGGGAIFSSSNAVVYVMYSSIGGNNAAIGGAILTLEASSLQMYQTECSKNSAVTGGGCISVGDNANATLEQSVFSGNKALSGGGVARITAFAILQLTNSSFEGNYGGQGGVLWMEMSTQAFVAGCNITSNYAPFDAGGIYATHSSSLSISGSDFSQNKAMHAGAILVDTRTTTSIASSTFRKNLESAIVAQGSAKLSAENCSFTRNNAVGNFQNFYSNYQLFVPSSNLEVNSGSGGGYSVALGMAGVGTGTGASTSGKGRKLLSLSALSAAFQRLGGGKMVTGMGTAMSMGGGGSFPSLSSDADHLSLGDIPTGREQLAMLHPRVARALSDSQFGSDPISGSVSRFGSVSRAADLRSHTGSGSDSDSEAWSGRARFLKGGGGGKGSTGSSGSGQTKGTKQTGANIIGAADNSTVISNTPKVSLDTNSGIVGGGALYATEFAEISLTHTNFSGNKALPYGGALYAEQNSTVRISGGKISENTAQLGGGFGVGGFAQLFTGVEITFFERNNASIGGGGLFFTGQAGGSVNASEFSGNYGTSGGAGVYVQRSLVNPLEGLEAAAKGLHKSFKKEMLSLDFTKLVFANNSALYVQGAAFYEASYEPSIRVKCTDCQSMTPKDTLGTVPSNILLRWPGVANITATANVTYTAKSFTAIGDTGNPIESLAVIVEDDYGNKISQERTSLALVSPNPYISGLLRSTTVNGRAVIPPIIINISPNDAVAFPVTMTLRSLDNRFPDVVKPFTIGFCPNGTYFDPSTYSCIICAVGNICRPGQPSVPCADGTYSFLPGAFSDANNDCQPCDDGGLTCVGGTCEIGQQSWLDYDTIDDREQGPSTLACIVTNGCNGYDYAGPGTPQCLTGYSETKAPMCGLCDNSYYNFIGYCNQCTSTYKTLFPLLIICVFIAWYLMGVMCDAFAAMDLFFEEVSVIALIASYNLNFPADWVMRLVQIYNLAIFDVDLVGPDCVMSFNVTERWVLGVMIVPLGGLSIYLVLWIRSMVTKVNFVHVFSWRKRSGGKPKLKRTVTQRLEDRGYEYSLIHGALSWVDGCYCGVLSKTLPILVAQGYRSGVMAYAPEIVWFSSRHLLLWIPSLIVSVALGLGLPLFYILVLLSAKKAGELDSFKFVERFGFLVDMYTAKFFWWHLIVTGLRMLYLAISTFLIFDTNIQIILTLPIQAFRIAMQCKFSPYNQAAHDLLSLGVAVGSFFFTLALVIYNYFGLTDFSEIMFAVSTLFMCLPFLGVWFYEVINFLMDRQITTILDDLWDEEMKKKKEKKKAMADSGVQASSSAGSALEVVVEPVEIVKWFRPHVVYPMLTRGDQEDIELLMRVRERFELCKSQGLGETDWLLGLKKNQRFAVLMQAFFGSSTSCLAVARIPKNGYFCVRHHSWHARGVDCSDPSYDGKSRTGMAGGSANGAHHSRSGSAELGGASGSAARGRDSGPAEGSTRADFALVQSAGEGIDLSERVDWDANGDRSEAYGMLDMAQMTVAFQKDLATLVHMEEIKTKKSIKPLVVSESIPEILGWLTSQESDFDDQHVFRELTAAVKEAAYSEAGGLTWAKCALLYFRKVFSRRNQNHTNKERSEVDDE